MSVTSNDFCERRGAQRGAGLIEVMVAVLILGIGLLGVAAMQATALRNSQSALERSQAVMHTYAILDAMRVNRDVARIGGYNLSSMTCDFTTGGDLAGRDRVRWFQSLHDNLEEEACGQIVCGTTECVVTVQWDDSRGSGGGTEQQVETRTRL